MDFSDIIVMLPILLFSVIVHEVAHGWVALKCGDPTARDAGRLTFNPIPHIDPFMTIILPLLLIVSNAGIVFGGAKPVPVNPYNLRGGERDNMLLSFAGPASNILLALVAFLISILVIVILGSGIGVVFFGFFRMVIAINLFLANFNLLPIPPLDGSHILAYFLKGDLKRRYQKLQRQGFLIFFGFIILASLGGVNILGIVFTPAMALLRILLRAQIDLLV